MVSIATVTSKGQVTLPVAIRRALSINAGDKLTFTVEDDRVLVQPAADFLSLAGSVQVPPEVRGAPWADIKEQARLSRGRQ